MQLRYEVCWHPEGIAPDKVRQHVSYINQLCSDVHDKIKASLKKAIAAREAQGWVDDLLTNDILHHVNFCHKR